MVEIEFKKGPVYEVRGLPNDPDLIRNQVVEAYLAQQRILHPDKPEQLGVGQRLLKVVFGEKRRREVQA